LFIPYFIYVRFDKASQRGGRRLNWFRKLSIWKHFCDYFPAHVIKESDLDPNQNYLFCYHPHGVLSFGLMTNFLTEGTKVSELFPGLEITPLTLESNFKVPFLRDFLLSLGAADVSRNSIQYLLNHPKKGKAALLVPGGAQEALESHPHTNDLVIRKRKGFVREALKAGAPLVPVFCFGETTLFDAVPNPQGSLLRRVQQKFLAAVGFSTPFINGRGIWQYTFGLLPRRVPLSAVVGSPVALPKIENPSDKEIEKYNQIYCESVLALFAKYKSTLDPTKSETIRIVE